MLAPCSQGWDVKEQALGLIQQWGLAFQARQDILPYFYETYMKLRLKVRVHSQGMICNRISYSKAHATFRYTCMLMRLDDSQGVDFPPMEESSPIFTPPKHQYT